MNPEHPPGMLRLCEIGPHRRNKNLLEYQNQTVGPTKFHAGYIWQSIVDEVNVEFLLYGYSKCVFCAIGWYYYLKILVREVQTKQLPRVRILVCSGETYFAGEKIGLLSPKAACLNGVP